jgi:hypothetical protein
VRFLGLIDTRANNPPTFIERLRRFLVPRQKQKFAQTNCGAGTRKPRAGSAPSRWHVLISALIVMSAFRTLKMFGRLAMRLPEKQAFAIGYAIDWRLRTESLRHLRLKPLAIPLTLFRSDDEPSLGDYGWSSLCPEVTVICTGGTHELMLSPPFLESFCNNFQDAVESASNFTDVPPPSSCDSDTTLQNEMVTQHRDHTDSRLII